MVLRGTGALGPRLLLLPSSMQRRFHVRPRYVRLSRGAVLLEDVRALAPRARGLSCTRLPQWRVRKGCPLNATRVGISRAEWSMYAKLVARLDVHSSSSLTGSVSVGIADALFDQLFSTPVLRAGWRLELRGLETLQVHLQHISLTSHVDRN